MPEARSEWPAPGIDPGRNLFLTFGPRMVY